MRRSRIFRIRVCLSFLLLLLLGAVLPGSTSRAAGGWELGARLQSATGWDSNPVEASADPEGEAFFRAQVEVGAARTLTNVLVRRVDVSVRGFDERFLDLAVEHRAQAEFRLRVDQAIGRRGGSGRWEFSTRARTYPDSTRRDFARGRIRWDGQFRLGPRGTLRPTFTYDQLDLEASEIDDRRTLEVGLGYDFGLRPGWVLFAGLELGGMRYDRASIQELPVGAAPVLGARQSDELRRVRLGFRRVGRTVAQVEYGYLAQSSNSLGSSFGRHEIRWIASRALGLGIRAQFFGNLESTHLRDAELEDFQVYLPGEELEARDDNNLVALQVSRELDERLDLHIRHAWYRNETFLVGAYYRKSIWSAGVTWQLGKVSGF